MNSNTRQLMLTAMTATFNGPNPDGDADGMYIPAEFVRNFSKLIVQDCLEVIGSAEALCGSGVPDRVLVDMIRNNVKGYFGVTE
jgi:hypothetical protein